MLEILPCPHRKNGSLNRFVLSDCMLRLSRRQSTWLSCIGARSGYKNVLLEEALSDKFFQVPPEAFAVDGLVSLAFVKGTILFYFGECGVVLNWLGASYPRLVLDGIKDFVDGES